MQQFESSYQVISADCDRHGFWKMDRLMVLMQELAGEHAMLGGFWREFTLARGAAWVLTRHEMAIDRYPEIADTVLCRTLVTAPRRGIYPRYYHILDQAGRSLVRGSSFWVLADIHTRQMVDLPEVASQMGPLQQLPLPLHNPGSVQEITGGSTRTFQHLPLYTDIDRNGHVNNTRAAEWALNCLGEHLPMAETPVKALKVSYHREILPGTALDLRFGLDGPDFSLICDMAGENALRLQGQLYGAPPA